MADELTIAMRLRGARAVNSELAGTTKEVNRLNAAASRASRPINNMGKSMARTGTVLARRLTLPIALGGAVAVKMGMDFDRTMTRVETLVGVGTKQVDKWRKNILQMSRDTGVAANDLGAALYFVTSSGLPLNKALAVTEAAGKGAALGLGDSATVAQVLTSAMNAYAKSGLTATHAMDVLIGGTKAGKLEASDLAESLGRVLPIASRLGVPLEQVVAGMEAMSITGADAEQAATQTSAFFSGLIKVTPMAAKALKGVHLTAAGLRDDLRNPRKGLLFVINELDKAFGGNIETMAKVFPNIRAMRTQLGLTGDQGANVKRVFDATANSSGSLGRSWQKLSESDSFKLNKAINDLKVSAIQFGAAIAPTVSKVATAFGHLFQLISGNQDVAVPILIALATLGPLLMAVGFGLRIYAASAMLAAGAEFAATVGATSLAAALLACPLTWIVLGLAALAVGLFILYKRSATFRAIVQDTFHWIKNHWRLLAVLIGGPFGAALVAVVNHFNSIKHAVRTVVHWVEVLLNKIGSIHFPHIPGSGILGKGADFAEGVLGKFASGGRVHHTQRAIVGEAGPEIVTLPAGAQVHSNADSFGSREIVVPVTLVMPDGRVLAQSTARVVADKKARR